MLVLGLSLAMLRPVGTFPGVLEILFYSFSSATFILFVVLILMNRSGLFSGVSAVPLSPATPAPKLLARVPQLTHATQVWALTAQDHYVRVLTDQGAALILMRLGDAIGECADIQGIRTHRSHWINLTAVGQAQDVRKTATLTLKNGETIPVSKSKMKDVAAALKIEAI